MVVSRSVALGVVHRCNLHLAWAQLRIGKRHHGITSFVDRGHQARFAFYESIHGHACERESHQAIDEVRAAGAQVVSEVAYYRFFPCGALDFTTQVFGDAHLLAMSECIGFAVFFYRVTLPLRTLRKDDERIIAWVVALVLDEQLDQVLQIDLVFGNATTHGCDVGRVECGVAGIASEYAKDANALVRPDRGPLPVDGVHSPRNRRRKTDAVFGVANIVVHSLWNREHLHALAIQFRSVTESIVTTDGDQVLETQRLNVLQHGRRHIVYSAGHALLGRLFGFEFLSFENGRQLFHFCWIGARGVQEGPASPIDGARVLAVQRQNVP